MSDWDKRHPGRGNVDDMDAVIARVSTHLESCGTGADQVDQVAAELQSGWTGEAAEAWAANTNRVAEELRTYKESVRTSAEAFNLYSSTVRSIDDRASRVADDFTAATQALKQAEQRWQELQQEEDPSSEELRLAQLGVRTAEDDQAAANSSYDALAGEREQVDSSVVAALQQVLPAGWETFGTLTASLPANAFEQGAGALALWFASLPEGADGDAAVRWMVEQLSDEDFEALLSAHPEIAERLMNPDASGAFAARFPELNEALSIADPDDKIAAVVAACEGMSAADLTALARCYPDVVHNVDGIPLTVRIAANRVVISADLSQSRKAVAEMNDTIATQTGGVTAFQQALINGFNGSVERCEDLLYGEVDSIDSNGNPKKINGHQVILYDPSAQQFGELVGYAGAANISILVGGTGTNLSNMSGQFNRAWDFVKNARDGNLAVITYLGGPMPQTLPEATSPSYALDIAPKLASFANGVRKSTSATITVAGHSYGGSVVGRAEAEGMIADRILHIESAGAGPGVDSTSDYADPDTPRYSITAPGDLINNIQGVSFGGVGHGVDPDSLDGVTRLESGREDVSDPNSALVRGLSSHSGVFGDTGADADDKPDAWANMFAVMTGGTVSMWTEPSVSVIEGSEGPWYTDVTYPMEDPSFAPPVKEVK